MTLRASDLPPQLTSLPHWIGWKLEQAHNSERLTKIPYNITTGHKASTTNPADWLPFSEAATRVNGYAGLGFVFTKDTGIFGLDLDNCYDGSGENKKIKAWAAEILRSFSNTYIEISPSGNGIHIFGRGSLPGTGKKVYVNSRGEPVAKDSPDADGACETYDFGRYFTVTGKAGGPLEVTDCQAAITALYYRLYGRPAQSAGTHAYASPQDAATVITEGGRHEFLLGVAARYRQGGMNRGEILTGLRITNESRCHPLKSDRELQGIADWIGSRTPKYLLVPGDLERSRRAIAAGSPQAQPVANDAEPAPNPAINEAGGAEKPDTRLERLQHAEEMLAGVIASGDPARLYADDFIDAMAGAGQVKQHEAKRRLKEAFNPAKFAVKEWQARIIVRETDIQAEQGSYSPYIVKADNVTPQAVLANAIILMKHLPLGFDAFALRTVLTAPAPWGSPAGPWTDNDDVRCLEWVQHGGILLPHPGTIACAAEAIARTRPFHPVVDYLRALHWDGTPRIDIWLPTYMGVPDTPYTRAIASKWLISCCRRVAEPGCQADYTIVFEGNQGRRKSTALRILAGDKWFTDDIADVGSKDAALQLSGKWIVELSELDAIRRAEMSTVKAWLTRREDHFRPPYGRRAGDYPRQNVFAASTNKDEWGMDDTGLRRFWPVRTACGQGAIDTAALIRDRDQLWAEAWFRANEGELSYLSEPAEQLAAGEQHQRQERDPWTDTVLEWTGAPQRVHTAQDFRSRPGRVSLADILESCLNIPKKDWDKYKKTRVCSILRLAGWRKHRANCEARGDGSTWRPEYWLPAETSEESEEDTDT